MKNQSEALDFFLNEKEVIAALDFPDEVIDYAFMLSKKEWQHLAQIFKTRSDLWKEGITYFAGFASVEDSVRILFQSIFENDEKIVILK
jgi:hypothetical protein